MEERTEVSVPLEKQDLYGYLELGLILMSNTKKISNTLRSKEYSKMS